MPEPIRVAVQGVLGKMGAEVLRTLCNEPDMEPVGAADIGARSKKLELPDGSGSIPFSKSLEDVIGGAQVLVDFTNAEGAAQAIEKAAPRNINLVIGSTGMSDEVMQNAATLAEQHGVGILVAPNFALGAVLMMHLARIAAPFFN